MQSPTLFSVNSEDADSVTEALYSELPSEIFTTLLPPGYLYALWKKASILPSEAAEDFENSAVCALMVVNSSRFSNINIVPEQTIFTRFLEEYHRYYCQHTGFEETRCSAEQVVSIRKKFKNIKTKIHSRDPLSPLASSAFDAVQKLEESFSNMNLDYELGDGIVQENLHRFWKSYFEFIGVAVDSGAVSSTENFILMAVWMLVRRKVKDPRGFEGSVYFKIDAEAIYAYPEKMLAQYVACVFGRDLLREASQNILQAYENFLEEWRKKNSDTMIISPENITPELIYTYLAERKQRLEYQVLVEKFRDYWDACGLLPRSEISAIDAAVALVVYVSQQTQDVNLSSLLMLYEGCAGQKFENHDLILACAKKLLPCYSSLGQAEVRDFVLSVFGIRSEPEEESNLQFACGVVDRCFELAKSAEHLAPQRELQKTFCEFSKSKLVELLKTTVENTHPFWNVCAEFFVFLNDSEKVDLEEEAAKSLYASMCQKILALPILRLMFSAEILQALQKEFSQTVEIVVSTQCSSGMYPPASGETDAGTTPPAASL